MFDTTATAEPATARGLLDAARTHRRAADRAEADLLATALSWADMHPAESIADAAVLGLSPWDDLLGGREHALPIAGPGAPLVAEFCVAELAAALGLRSEQGRDLIGETLELAHRLPKLWARVQAGEVQTWRARRTARATMALSVEAAAHVDRHLAPYAHKVGLPTVDRLIAEAVARFMPALAERQARDAADRRAVEIDTRTVTFDGTCRMYGELDLADALDLDTALNTGADALVAAGSAETKHVLRSVALGDLARGECPLPLTGSPADPTSTKDGTGAAEGEVSTSFLAGARSGSTTENGRSVAVTRRQVVLHVHLTDAVLAGAPGICRVEGTAGQGGRHLITPEQVRAWCATAGRVTIRPVIDTAGHISVEAYEIPDRLAEQIGERDIGCRFPWCERPADRCDTDHIIEHNRGGPTASDNLAPLCRHHHRLKTHGHWHYTMIEPGTYLWSSPPRRDVPRRHRRHPHHLRLRTLHACSSSSSRRS